MNITIAKSTVTAILLACMMNAFAGAGNMPREGRVDLDMRQAERRVHWIDGALARRDGEDFPRGERGEEREERRQRRLPEERQRYVSEQDAHAPDESRRGGRMSPEERRALRRQINEAGRDLYGSGR